MKQFGRLIAAALLLGGQFAVVQAQAGPALDEALGVHCGRTACTITNNPGGDIDVFTRAAQEVVSEGKHLRIDGLCASACVLLADLARANTCITPAAEMAVHKAYVVQVVGHTTVNGAAVPVGNLIARQDPPQSADIDAWIRRHGGYPTEGVNVMPLKAAALFWTMC
jgi:hypothetical protein